MHTQQTERTALLLGEERVKALAEKHVLVVGLGGVGGIAVEMLARAGVGRFTLVDGDKVSISNTNRQVIAFMDNIGTPKVDAMAHVLRRINPDIALTCYNQYLEEYDIAPLLERDNYDFVLDCIDTVAPKCALLAACRERKIAVVSSMGAGAKSDPSRIKVDDISKTSYCLLARVVRRRLKEMGIKKGIPTIFSTEEARKEAVRRGSQERGKGSTVGTVSYMPNLFGCHMAAYVLEHL